MLHGSVKTSDVHIPYNWVFSSATDRDTTTLTFAISDIGKLSLQQDDYTLWMLTSQLPTWVKISATTTGQAAMANETLPTQSGNSGKFLTTDGANVSWGTPSGTGGITSWPTVAPYALSGDMVTIPAGQQLIVYNSFDAAGSVDIGLNASLVIL